MGAGALYAIRFLAKYGGQLKALPWYWKFGLPALVLGANGILFIPAVNEVVHIGAPAWYSFLLVGIFPEYILMLLGVITLRGDTAHAVSVGVMVERFCGALYAQKFELRVLLGAIAVAPITKDEKDLMVVYWSGFYELPPESPETEA
jgi:hypothetical protein